MTRLPTQALRDRSKLPVARLVTAVAQILEALVWRSPSWPASIPALIDLPPVCTVRVAPTVQLNGRTAPAARRVNPIPLVSMHARGVGHGRGDKRNNESSGKCHGSDGSDHMHSPGQNERGELFAPPNA